MARQALSSGIWVVPAAVLALAWASGGPVAALRAEARPALVVDTTFQIVTADPAQSFEPTSSLVERAVFDTLLTYGSGSVARPVPLLARAYASSNGGKTWTFTLRRDVHFADGTPLTAADVVFSFRRLINLRGRPAFLLQGDTVKAAGPYTVVIRSPTPAVAMPQIVASTSLAVLNSRLARRHGATDAPDAYKRDHAEGWLNSAASVGVGSGPYVLKTYNTTVQTTLAPNDRYWRAPKPAWGAVVIRNLVSTAQRLDVQRGTHEVAIDLSLSQAADLRRDRRLRVDVAPSPWVFLLLTNDSPAVSAVTSNRHFQNAIRYGLDYRSLVEAAGKGAIQAPGVVPSSILGSLSQEDRIVRDTARARSELAASGLGQPKVELEYPADVTLNGVPFSTIAQRVQANLAQVGIRVDLNGVTQSIWLNDYVNGKMAFGLASRQVDYPDALDSLAFMPGELVGAHVGWPAGADPMIERLAASARRTLDVSARAALFRAIQVRLNRVGPYFPLIEPAQVFVTTRDVANATFNLVYQLDVTRTRPH